MRTFTLLVVFLLLATVLAIGGCGESSSGGGSYSTPDVTMGQDNFDHSSLVVSSGTTVKFSSPTSAAPHILCVGENGQCAANGSGPTELTGGKSVHVDPGETKSVTFETPGTYKIACTLHPMMNMTITVQ